VSDPRPSTASVAIEYAAVTERVGLEVAPLEGSGAPEEAFTLATEACRGELERVRVAGKVAILRGQRTDEGARVQSLKMRPAILSVGDSLGEGWPEVDLAADAALAGREARRVRTRSLGAQACPGRPYPGRRRGLRRHRRDAGRAPQGCRVLPGWGPDQHGGHVRRAPCGKIYGHHSRTRARSRAAGFPVLTEVSQVRPAASPHS
jgi:hypothetical protein